MQRRIPVFACFVAAFASVAFDTVTWPLSFAGTAIFEDLLKDQMRNCQR